MTQQINLYQPVFRRQQQLFESKSMLQGLALVLAALLLFYGLVTWQTRQFEQRLASIERQREQTLERMNALQANLPQRQQDAALKQEIERLQQVLAAKQAVVERLGERAAGNTVGFAGHLAGLARRRPSELWLEQLMIAHGGEVLELRGYAYSPEQVPKYLQRLAQEPVFNGLEFRRFQISRTGEARRPVLFSVRTTAEEAP